MSIKNNLGCSNATFYDYIFPTKEYILYSPNVDYETNDIQFVSGIVYGAIGCLDSETLISVPLGYIPLKELREGDEVIGISNNKPVISIILKKHKGILNTRLYQIISSSGNRINASPKHKFNSGTSWKNAKDLNINNDITTVGSGDGTYREGLDILSRNSRWRRKSLFSNAQDKNRNRLYYRTYFMYNELLKRINEMDYGKISSKTQDNSRQKSFNKEEIQQDSLQSNYHRMEKIKGSSIKNSSLSNCEERTSSFIVSMDRIKREDYIESLKQERLHKKRNTDLLGFKEIKLRRERIREIYKTDKRKVALQDITTTSGNYIANNFLVHNSGKSCIGISITDEAVKKYGIEEVNSSIEPYGDLEKTIKYGIRKSLVNILFTDDVTLRPISRSTLRLFFQIRHLYKNAFNVNNGYILALLGIHRFHASVPELRTNIDFLVVKTLPSNDYDFNVIKRRIGEKGVKLLMNIEKKKLKSPAYKKYSLYWLRTGERGLLTTELPDRNYMTVI